MAFHEHVDEPLPSSDSPANYFTGRAILLLGLAAIGSYLLVSYVLAPATWRRYEHRHPALADAPRVTHTENGIPGDPVNLCLIGSEEDLQRAMLAAHWFPADPVTLKSSLRIAADTVFHRTYNDAPVSPLLLFGRKQDLAFEQPLGGGPRQRHHVRFWKAEQKDDAGRSAWFGAATFDTRVGLSHSTGQITHHISPFVDADRDRVLSDLAGVNVLSERYYLPAFQPQLTGKNGGGDRWQTDGRLGVGVLAMGTPAADMAE
jgi:hypothetical protein